MRYAKSNDGVVWRRTGNVCIDYDDFAEAIGRPCVYLEDDRYKMFYSYRRLAGYRTDPACSDRLGHAESSDVREWLRMDDPTGLDRSEEGWDSQMNEFCSIYRYGDRRFLLYNGNGFGQTGIGCAVLESDLEAS